MVSSNTRIPRLTSVAASTSNMPDFNFNAQAGLKNRPDFRAAPPPFDQMQPLQDELNQLRAEQKPLALTIGAELEMIVAHCKFPNEGIGAISHADTGRQAIYELLSQPLSAKCATCGESHRFKLALHRPQRNQSVNYSAWSIETDCTIELDRGEKRTLRNDIDFFDFYQIEIKTRILELDRPQPTIRSLTMPSHTHSVTATDEITAVLDRLNRGFHGHELSEELGSFSILVNESCGLHVHVGNHHHGFPLRTVKNAVSTYVANELPIDNMHAVNRIGWATPPQACPSPSGEPGVGDNYTYNIPWSAHHNSVVSKRCHERGELPAVPLFSLGYPDIRSEDPAVRKAACQYSAEAQLTIIQNTPSISDLHHLQGVYSHTSTVELANLTPTVYQAKTNTIEFRQHVGTIQPIEVLSWIDTVTSLVRHAHDTPDEEFAELCMKEFRDPAYHILDLLKTIGCSGRTVKHYKQKLGMRSDGGSYADRLAGVELLRLSSKTGAAAQLLAPLQKHLIEKNRAANDPVKVLARINTKFLAGGYGQFSDAYLDRLLFVGAEAVTARESLRVGSESSNSSPAKVDTERRGESTHGLPHLPMRNGQYEAEMQERELVLNGPRIREVDHDEWIDSI